MLSCDMVKEVVSEKVTCLEEEYKNVQGLILSESDLKCLIYRKLYDCFYNPQSTIDRNIKSIPIHTEIPWYDEKEKLTIRPDITILNPKNISITRGVSIRLKQGKLIYGNLPSKGFEFSGPAVVLEIKFNKNKTGITKSNVKKFQDDVTKMLKLAKRRNRPREDKDVFGILIIFNKTNKYVEEFKRFRDQYSKNPCLHIIYCTGNVAF